MSEATLAGRDWERSSRRQEVFAQLRPLLVAIRSPTIHEFVRDGLAHEWSPEQITGRLEQQYPDESGRRVSAQTIYAWIEQDEDREHWQSFLRRRGKRPCRRKPAESAGGARIADRPEIIELRLRLAATAVGEAP